jgi:tetratricopeptide (TPR) repeat protein
MQLGINQLQYHKSIDYSQLLYYAAVDTNVTVLQITDTLKTESEVMFRLLLGDLYLSIGEYTKAATAYEKAGMLSTDEATLLYVELRNITIEMFQDNKTWFNLGDEGYPYLDDIEDIADTETQAGFIARNILSLINDTIYEETLLTKDGGGSFRKGRFDNDEDPIKITVEEHDYRLKPNLFEGRLLANVTLKTDETGKLEVYNLQGTKTGEVNLTSGKNELDLTSLNLSSGVYVYRVWANYEIKKTDKLVKLK